MTHDKTPDDNATLQTAGPGGLDPEADIETVAEPVNLFQPYTLDKARQDAAAAGEGFSTGLASLDALDFRFRPGKLYVIAGRPGEGKTALTLELLIRHIENPDRQDNGPAVFVTYEERLSDIFLRLVLREYGRAEDGNRTRQVAQHKRIAWLVGKGTGSRPLDSALDGAAAAVDSHMHAGQLVIIDGDQDGRDVAQLLRGLELSARITKQAPSLVAVDYYQKIRTADDLRGASRQEQLQDVTDRLRRFAKGQPQAIGQESNPALAVPVIVAAQVNREAVKVQPELEHLREADDPANDAAGVLTLWRKPSDDPTTDAETLSVRVVKNRDGKRDVTRELHFFGATGCIDDPAESNQDTEAAAMRGEEVPLRNRR